MLNYIRADLYRIFSRFSAWIWCSIFAVIPALAVLGIGGKYPMQRVLFVAPAGIYLVFLVVSMMLNEYTFREDMQLGLFKNDTTNGVSRAQLFTAKYLTGLFLEFLLWILCSGCTAMACAKVFGMQYLLFCFKAMFSPQAINWILVNLFLLALFQVISIYVKKTSMLILVCLIISTLFNNIKTVLIQVFPNLDPYLTIFVAAETNTPSLIQVLLMFLLPLTGTAVLLLIGCSLFKHIEF